MKSIAINGVFVVCIGAIGMLLSNVIIDTPISVMSMLGATLVQTVLFWKFAMSFKRTGSPT